MSDYLLNALATLFVIVDPIGLAPLFLALTVGFSPKMRRAIALRATLIAAVVLVAFALIGELLLGFLGISMAAFRIAGGLLLFWTAFEMVFEKRRQRQTQTAQEAAPHGTAQDLAVFPLAIPLIAGPGAISAVILLAAQAPDAAAYGALLAVTLVILGATVAIFLAAERVDRFMGDTARAVLTRLLGVILAALAVQYVADGILAIAATG